MRVDLALKYLCLVKSRSLVKHLCDDESLWVNGRLAKPSVTLRPGDRVTLRYPHRTLTIEVLAVPQRQLSRGAAAEHYTKLEESGPADDNETDL
jgi:ribosomal 50S subunit-recycling heat shock protein